MSLLSVRGLAVSYGHVEAVRGIDLDLAAGEITTLVGANGAGKSTTLMALSGLVKKAAGQVLFDGQDISAAAPHRIVGSGLVQVAEGRATLTTLNVRENLELGAYTRRDGAAARARDIDHVYSLFPRLAERATQMAGSLSGGEQQMLAIGRALMARPRLLLLDEPSLGLAPKLVETIFEVIREINAQGTTIMLVEQNAHMALQIAAKGYVMEVGRIVLTDQAEHLMANENVRSAYLGE